MSSSRYLKKIKLLLRFLPDRAYIQLYYFIRFKKLCNLSDPTTFNEKLQWLKLYGASAAESALVDKMGVKAIVASKIGETHVIPTLAVYESADEIDFAALPNSFVLKCTHDSEGVVIVKEKSAVNELTIRTKLNAALKQNFYYIGREPHYRDVRPRIIAEPYLEDRVHGQLMDYKFLCFGGEVRALFVASDRSSGTPNFDYFDASYSPLSIRQAYPNSAKLPEKPKTFERMLEIARILSEGHPHVRVDLYEVNGEIFFGELTFFHFSGFAPFVPPVWDRIWGDWLSLPELEEQL